MRIALPILYRSVALLMILNAATVKELSWMIVYLASAIIFTILEELHRGLHKD